MDKDVFEDIKEEKKEINSNKDAQRELAGLEVSNGHEVVKVISKNVTKIFPRSKAKSMEKKRKS